jgi:hypothetical protein
MQWKVSTRETIFVRGGTFLNRLFLAILLVVILMADCSNGFAENKPKAEDKRTIAMVSLDADNDVLVETVKRRGLKGPVKEVVETEEYYWLPAFTQHTRVKSHSFYEKNGLLQYEELNNQGAMYCTSYANGLPTSFKIISTSLDKPIFETKNTYSCSANSITLQELLHEVVPLKKYQYEFTDGKITKYTVFDLNGKPYEVKKVSYDISFNTVQIITDSVDEYKHGFNKTEKYSIAGRYRILEQTLTNNRESSRQISYVYDDQYNLVKVFGILKIADSSKEIVQEYKYSEFDKYGNWTSRKGVSTVNGSSYFPPNPITRVITYYE